MLPEMLLENVGTLEICDGDEHAVIVKLVKRPRWKRIIRAPISIWKFWRVLRLHHGPFRALYFAWRFTWVGVKT